MRPGISQISSVKEIVTVRNRGEILHASRSRVDRTPYSVIRGIFLSDPIFEVSNY